MSNARVKRPHGGGKLPVDLRLAVLADRQHGVVSSTQLAALGLGRRAVEYRIAVGRLHRIHRGVYAVGRPSLTTKGHWMAAVLACGPGAALSHRSAAALWGVGRNGWKIEVTVPGDRRRRGPIRVHRARLDPAEVTACDGIPVTTVARTLLDLAAILTRDQLAKGVEESERRQLFDLRAVETALTRAGRRQGVPALRAVLAEYRDPLDTRSELERDFARLIRKALLPDPQTNVLVEGFQVDAFWPRCNLVVELDSRGYHASPRAFETDRVRDATLQLAGYRVIRITHRRLQSDPTGVAKLISALTR